VSLYDALGVDRNATLDQIKKAFRQKAQKCHPDRGGQVDEFQTLREAYEVLKDPERRKRYDKTGLADKPKDKRAEAFQKVSELLAHFLETNSFENMDYMAIMKNQIANTQASAKRDIKAANKSINRIKRLLKSTQGELPIMVLDAKLSKLNEHIASREHALEMMNIASEIVEDLKCGDLHIGKHRVNPQGRFTIDNLQFDINTKRFYQE
jgi:curved DNA-binding protein CbpA